MVFSKKQLILYSTLTLSLLTAPSIIAKGDVSNTKLVNQTNLTQTNDQTNQQNPNIVENQANNGFTAYTKDDTTLSSSANPTSSTANQSSASASSSQPAFYSNSYGYSHFTRYNLEHMQDNTNRTNKNPIGDFNQKQIYDLPTAVDTRPGVKGQKLNVWDSWPLQNANGQNVTYKGYNIVFALAGNPNKDYKLPSGQAIQDSRIFVFYQKQSQAHQGVKSWHNAGPLFKSNLEGTHNDPLLKQQLAQWSGQTVITKDGQIHVLYTTFNGSNQDDWQALATANISLNVSKNKVSVDHKKTTNHKTILKADGKIYQTLTQAKNDNYDENVFRDVHFFTYKNKNYIIFAANSTNENGPEGDTALYNQAYLGGDKQFQQAQVNLLAPTANNPWHNPGVDYNAVIGVAQLNNNFSVKKVMKPILGMNTITDEFERPNLIPHNGKWYLFGITRGYKLATPNVTSTDSYLIGFVGNSPFGPFKPLNKNGLVIRNTRHWNSRKYTYSFYVLNNNSKNPNAPLVVTSYMTNTKVSNNHQTFAPSMLLKLNGDNATIEKQTLHQGQLVK